MKNINKTLTAFSILFFALNACKKDIAESD